MQQTYNCPKCGQYVQYGQSQCYYCGNPLYWQAPVQQDQTPMPSPQYTQDPAPQQNFPDMPGQPPVQGAAYMQPPSPVQTPPNLQNQAPMQGPQYMQPPAPFQPAQDACYVAPAQEKPPSLIDKLKSLLWLTPPASPSQPPQEQFNTRPSTISPMGQDRAVKKDLLVAYLCWICLGCHYIYLGKMRAQVIFWLTLGGFGLWWIIDGFSLPGMVKDYNIDQLLGAVLEAEKETQRNPSAHKQWQ